MAPPAEMIPPTNKTSSKVSPYLNTRKYFYQLSLKNHVQFVRVRAQTDCRRPCERTFINCELKLKLDKPVAVGQDQIFL